jgi:hypothetical protein
MKRHELKILPLYFGQVLRGAKTFEIRLNDRDFTEGDLVLLREWRGEYTGRSIAAVVGTVTDYEQGAGYVVFSLLEVVARLPINTSKGETP